jgi:hypothetical protein
VPAEQTDARSLTPSRELLRRAAEAGIGWGRTHPWAGSGRPVMGGWPRSTRVAGPAAHRRVIGADQALHPADHPDAGHQAAADRVLRAVASQRGRIQSTTGAVQPGQQHFNAAYRITGMWHVSFQL